MTALNIDNDACAVVELRQYTLHPGGREVLIELFERELVETQEAVGMTVMGQFRDLADADRVVWLRGFCDMPSRRTALAAFYGGAVWQAHRAAANATMIDSDNVLLLRPAWPGSGIDMAGRIRDATIRAASAALVEAHIFHLREPATAELLGLCRQTLARAGNPVLGCYVSEPAVNDFPRLPVREGEPVLVLFESRDDRDERHDPARSDARAHPLTATIAAWLERPVHTLRLAPTPRSAIRA